MADAPRIKRVFDSKTIETIITTPISNSSTVLDQYTEPLLNDVFLPKGLNLDNIDQSVINMLRDGFAFSIHKQLIPLFDFSLQKFSEKGLTFTELYKNESFKLPILILTKDFDIQKGTNLGKTQNVATNELYTIKKVERVTEGGDIYFDIYQVPQPIYVDTVYYLEFVGETISDVNKISEKIHIAFAAGEVYIKPNGYNIPLILDSVSDQSEKSIEKRRYYSQVYKILCKGYILNTDDYIVTNTLKNISLDFLTSSKTVNREDNCKILKTGNCIEKIEYSFYRNGINEISAKITDTFNVGRSNMNDNSFFIFQVNGNTVNIPFSLQKDDILKITYINNITKSFSLFLFPN